MTQSSGRLDVWTAGGGKIQERFKIQEPSFKEVSRFKFQDGKPKETRWRLLLGFCAFA